MRASIAIGLLLGGTVAFAQAPAPAPKPAAPAPAAPAQARRPAAAARSGMAITVTTPQGATLRGVEVEILGASDRRGETNASGQISFTGMQAGAYRVRFSGGGVITFE